MAPVTFHRRLFLLKSCCSGSAIPAKAGRESRGQVWSKILIMLCLYQEFLQQINQVSAITDGEWLQTPTGSARSWAPAHHGCCCPPTSAGAAPGVLGCPALGAVPSGCGCMELGTISCMHVKLCAAVLAGLVTSIPSLIDAAFAGATNNCLCFCCQLQ